MKNKYSINTQNAPIPAGHYSQAVVYGDLIFVSGILPINPKTNFIEKENLEKSVIQVFDNLNEILKSSNSNLQNILKVTVYISDMNYWAEINNIYTKILGESKPARTVVEVSNLHHSVILEIDAIAHTNQ